MNLNFLLIYIQLWPVIVTAYSYLSDKSLQNLPTPTDEDFDVTSGAIISPILRTRVPGSSGSHAVLQHFIDFFSSNLPEWSVSIQNFSSKTPAPGYETVSFNNFIATRDPPWVLPGDTNRLVLAAHYDSRLQPEGFIGAIDSAASCAILLHVAKSIDAALTRKWDAIQGGADMMNVAHAAQNRSLQDYYGGFQIILFDGEEDFVNWTATDSLYGSRALAEEWGGKTYERPQSQHQKFLESVDLLVLLDLLGASDPKVRSYFAETHDSYKLMSHAEHRLRALNLLEIAEHNHGVQGSVRPYLNEYDKKLDPDTFWYGGEMEDDHIPFWKMGVKSLHLIPLPYPDVWHTLSDDGEHLDLPSVRNWAKIVTAFTAEWLGLEGYLL